MNRILNKGWIWIIVFSFLLLFYYFFNPVEFSWMPQCVFHRITGMQCMGCGSQRMIYSLLHGDIKGAWEANRFLMLCLPYLALLLWSEFHRKKYQRLYAALHSVPVIIIISAMLVAWLILRNILGM
ncbi:MAG: DUF2752 domain-containing protein [Muribaculaceae bacterium]|nr:DUF2752 domain-containing protein [Muribaculaceae bacterium]